MKKLNESLVETLRESKADADGVCTSGNKNWYVSNLWKQSKDLPIVEYEVSKLYPLLDEWLNEHITPYKSNEPVLLLNKSHFTRIHEADLKYPIILSSSGKVLMDGYHRLFKAWLAVYKTIKVVKFDKNPQPDFITK